jgi:subfamily B ATP-binding cassette protein MsbA
MSSPPEQKTSLQIYLRLLTHVRPFIGAFAVSIVGYLIYASAQPMLASVLKYFVDGLSSPDGLNQLTLPLVGPVELMYGIPVLVVLISSWQGLGSFLGSYFLAKVSLGLVDRLRRALFESLLRLPNTYFDQHNSGHLISRINYDATMVTGAATEAVKVVIREGFIVIALFGYLLWMNWKLTLVMVAILPIIGVMVGKASKRFRKQSRKIQASMGDVTHVASEIIQGYRVVRSFGGEDYESARFGRAITRNTASQLKMVRTSASFTPALQLVTFSSMAFVLFLVLYLRGDATAGDLAAYLTAAGLLPKPIRQLSEISSTIQKGLAGAERIFEQLDEAPETDLGTYETARASGRIEVRDLSFTYPGSDAPVLKNLNFTIEPGQMVALVGRSGSGKSTLASLIPRFYHHDDGQILIDGVDVEDYSLRNLRQQIALVTQHVSLFNDTVTNNIAYGDMSGLPREKVEAAAESACAREFIKQLPQGFDTLIGENGVLLSGGQRQRLAIARAILKDSPILILDEATSALDTESERHIQMALENLTTNRTTIVIAHRLSTIEKADVIMVMEGGEIIESGSHDELIAHDGAYKKLHAMHFSEEGAEGTGAET